MQKWKDIKIKMEFNKYDYFYSSKNTKESLYRTKFAIQLFNFENHLKYMWIRTWKKNYNFNTKKRRTYEDNEELKKTRFNFI